MPAINAINPASVAAIQGHVVQTSLTASAVKAPSVDVVNTALSTKASLLATSTISANGAITAGDHANRPLTRVVATAACTFTAGTAGAVDGDEFSFLQTGAGALTLTGDVELAPGVASATTNGAGSMLFGVYSTDRVKLVLYLRTEASGGGGITTSNYHFSGTAPEDAAENAVINAVSIGGAIAAGSSMHIYFFGAYQDTGAENTGTGVWLVKLNGVQIGTVQFASAGAVPSKIDLISTAFHGAAAQANGLMTTQGGLVNTTITTSGANTLTIASQRTGGSLLRDASMRVMVEVNRA